MNIISLLLEYRPAVVKRASLRVYQCHLESPSHTSEEAVRRTIETLYELTQTSVRERDAGPMIAWGERMARERYEVGCCLHEMQTVINTLESALWQTIVEKLEPKAFAEAIGLVSTALGMAKDALAREWVSLASKRRAHSLDMKALFSGTASRDDFERPAE
jgi:hypothetical protein